MTIQNGFFKSINGDRKYLAEFFTSYFASFIGNGVFPNPSTNLQVIANQNFATIVRPGKGWINGHYLNNDADIVINHQPPDGVLRRIDRIVFAVNFDSRSMDIYLKQGTPGTNAQAPTLLRTATIYELALADISFNPGMTSISQSNITDQRMNKALCGIVHGVVEQLDTTTLFNQYQQFLVEKGVEFDQQLAVNQQVFDDWFAQLNDILDGDVASNLANMIITHTNNATSQKHIEVVSTIPTNLANKGLLLQIDDVDNPNNAPEVPTSMFLNTRIDSLTEQSSYVKKGLSRVDAVSFNKVTTDVPLITFQDDDGFATVYTRLRPIFNAKGVPLTSAISTNLIGANGYMTEAQVREMADEGHEFVNHTSNHRTYTSATADLWEEEILRARIWLYERGYAYDIFVNPQAEGANRIDIMSRYAKCAFNSNRGGVNEGDTLNTYNLQRAPFGTWIPNKPPYEGETLEYYKAIVDECVAKKGWLVFMSHVNAQDVNQDIILGQLIDYIKSLNVEIVTTSEGFARKANRIEVGDTVLLNRFGVLNDTYVFERRKHSRTNVTPINDYPDNKITISQLDFAYLNNSFGYLFADGGLLYTYRIGGENDYYRQKFEVAGRTLTYTRNWKNNAWTNWEIDALTIIEKNTRTNSMLPSAYPINTKTYTELDVQTMATAGFPFSDDGGLLITDTTVLGYVSGHIRQELRKYKSNDTYIRNAINASSWTPWTKVY